MNELLIALFLFCSNQTHEKASCTTYMFKCATNMHPDAKYCIKEYQEYLIK